MAGWEIRIDRKEVQHKGDFKRTYADEEMDFKDSWDRLSDVIASLEQFCAAAFKTKNYTRIPNATEVITDEPQ